MMKRHRANSCGRCCAVKRSRAAEWSRVGHGNSVCEVLEFMRVLQQQKKKQYKGVGGQKERRETWEEVGREERNKSEKK